MATVLQERAGSYTSAGLTSPLGGIGLTQESNRSAVSWAAIFAGALAAAAASLILGAIGSGLGLASVSIWPESGASATTFTVMTAVWLVIVQWVASGLGGYLTGRLRVKWAGTHTHEVFFRDTVHGLVTWAVATLFVGSLLASAASSALSTGTHAAAAAVSSASQIAPYTVDRLFRSTHSDTTEISQARAESVRILAQSLTTGDVSTPDRSYLAELVAARTGVSRQEAQQRVDDVIAEVKAGALKARQAADTARKSAAMASLLTALSMLIGAFIACVAAALGGRQRDEHV
jgi:hypothetical protein